VVFLVFFSQVEAMEDEIKTEVSGNMQEIDGDDLVKASN
jgi:hypothetical protein